jgi:hypothetical protein
LAVAATFDGEAGHVDGSGIAVDEPRGRIGPEGMGTENRRAIGRDTHVGDASTGNPPPPISGSTRPVGKCDDEYRIGSLSVNYGIRKVAAGHETSDLATKGCHNQRRLHYEIGAALYFVNKPSAETRCCIVIVRHGIQKLCPRLGMQLKPHYFRRDRASRSAPFTE